MRGLIAPFASVVPAFLVLYLCLGHAMDGGNPRASGMKMGHSIGHAVGSCLMIAAAPDLVSVPAVPVSTPEAPARPGRCARLHLRQSIDDRSRASPIWLQRFLT